MNRDTKFTVKRGTSLRVSHPPTILSRRNTLHISWVDARTGSVRVWRGEDLGALDDGVDLGVRSRTGTSLAADDSGVVLAWVDAVSQEILVALSLDGLVWGAPLRTGIRGNLVPSVAFHEGRLWLARTAPGRDVRVLSSPDGGRWTVEQSLQTGSTTPAALVVLEGELNTAWVDGPRGALHASTVGAGGAGERVLHEGPLSWPSLTVRDSTLHLAWFDEEAEQVVVQERTAGGWRERLVVHERVEGAPTLFALEDDVGLAWVRADGSQCVHFRSAAEDAILEGSHAFRGDVCGHPSALTRDHHTPYPYLGLVVLPSDWSLPQGKSAAELLTTLGSALTHAAAFWKEASFGAVDITHDVHPAVVTLPSPMSTYLVRARPKLIEGHGAADPVTLPPAATLTLAAEGGFAVTATFPGGTPSSLKDVATTINAAVDAAGYSGPIPSRPVATTNENGQLRLQTAGQVDAGDALAVTGGSALDPLGLDSANRTVHEGSTTQVDHLELMVRDALAAAVQGRPNPQSFVAKYFGCAVSVASDIGWYVLRANASRGPADVSGVVSKQDVRIAHYVITAMDDEQTHAHEVGHNLDFPDLYEEGARNVGVELGTWDVMDSNSDSHPTAWAKDYQSSPSNPSARWVGAANVATLDATKQSVEVLLGPLESGYPATNPFAQSHPGVPLVHAVKIKIADGHAYYVENRQRGPYSDPHFGDVQFSKRLPGDGLVITDAVDDLSGLSLDRVPAVLVHPWGMAPAPTVPPNVVDQVMAAGTVAAKQAVIDAYVPAVVPQDVADGVARATTRDEVEWLLRSYRDGRIRSFYPVDGLLEDVLVEQLPNGDGEIRVKLLEVIGAKRPYVYRVKVTWGRRGSWFDLEIRRWTNPPPYESPDIWIDSEENGWDTYQHSDAVANPGVPGHPVLNGDRPWVGHDNRVTARVWNRGDIPVNNLRVDFREVVPPGVGDGYTFDTDFIDIPAGGSALAVGTWRPRAVPAHEHGCVAAHVEYRPWDLATQTVGEANDNNNIAQENIDDFYVTKASPYSMIELPFEFASPLPEACEMMLRARGLEPGWSMHVEPYRFLLRPGERMQGTMVLEAAETVPLEDPHEGLPAPTVSLEAMVRIGCTWERVGGLSMIAHTVRRSSLDAVVDPAGTGLHVVARARDTVGPVVGANVAIALVLDDRVLAVTRALTDGSGSARAFVPVDWGALQTNASLALDIRLSPLGQSGPASLRAVVPRP